LWTIQNDNVDTPFRAKVIDPGTNARRRRSFKRRQLEQLASNFGALLI
jgi:hypothetical protein